MQNEHTNQKFSQGIELFVVFLKAMGLAFTGGLSATPVLKYEIVDNRKLLNEEDFLDAVALSQSLPGIIGLNYAILIGQRIGGMFGAILASLGTILPAFLSMLLATVLFRELPESRIVQGAIQGIRVSSVILIFGIGLRIVLKYRKDSFSILVVLFAFLLPLLTDISTFVTICFCGVAGIAYICLVEKRKQKIQTGKEENH